MQARVKRWVAGLDIPVFTITGSFNGLGIDFEQLGKLAQAQNMFERALAIKVKHLPVEHPSLETTRHNLEMVNEVMRGTASPTRETITEALTLQRKLTLALPHGY